MNKRVVSMVSFTLAVALFGACDKPSEANCKRAVTNIRQLMGTSKMSIDGAQDAAWVRSCRGTAKEASVSCAIEAKSLDGLKTCGLLKGADLDELMQIEADLKKLHDTAEKATVPPVAVVDAGVEADAATATDSGTNQPPPPDAGGAAKPATP